MFRVLVLILFLALPASAQLKENAWINETGSDRTSLTPGQRAQFIFSTNVTPRANNLDTNACGTVQISYEDDYMGTDTAASARLVRCPARDSADAECTTMATYTDDTPSATYQERPAWYNIIPVAPTTGGGIARVFVYCGQELSKAGPPTQLFYTGAGGSRGFDNCVATSGGGGNFLTGCSSYAAAISPRFDMHLTGVSIKIPNIPTHGAPFPGACTVALGLNGTTVEATYHPDWLPINFTDITEGTRYWFPQNLIMEADAHYNIVVRNGVNGVGDACGGNPPALPLIIKFWGYQPLQTSSPGGVLYNPYAGIDFGTYQTAKFQTHDHIDSPDLGSGPVVAQVEAYDDAGYDILTLGEYGGTYRNYLDGTPGGCNVPATSPKGEWCLGFINNETTLGAPAISGLTNIKLYVNGQENAGTFEDVGINNGTSREHWWAVDLQNYIEGEGCLTSTNALCDSDMQTKTRNPNLILDSQRYSGDGLNSQETSEVIKANGGIAIFNHPSRGWGDYSKYSGYLGQEIINNYFTLREESGFLPTGAPNMLLNWDVSLTINSKRWGFAVNDHYGPYYVPHGAGGELPEVTKLNTDVGYGIMYLPPGAPITLEAFRDNLVNGRFIAVHDNQFPKNDIPVVSNVCADEPACPGLVGVTTVDMDETLTWYSTNGVVGTGFSVPITSIPVSSGYVRVQIEDAQGRIVFLQPFSLRRY